MKITTDACLLGALQPVFPNEGADFYILDIGTGTGLLSLMMAQLNPCSTITAIEIDHETAMEAQNNFTNSPFASRITLIEGNILDFNPDKQFHHIICNPPFYESQLKSPDLRKNIAHHEGQLTLEQLLPTLKRLILPEGTVSLLIPYYRETEVCKMASLQNLFAYRIIRVRQTPKHGFFRSIVFFSPQNLPVQTEAITIRNTENEYTTEFTELLGPFYLNL